MSCTNTQCRRGAVNQPQWFCRCGMSFCSEACFIQAWHSGHSRSCSAVAEINKALEETDDTSGAPRSARRKGAAQVAAAALSRVAPEAPNVPAGNPGVFSFSSKCHDVKQESTRFEAEPVLDSRIGGSAGRGSSDRIEKMAALSHIKDFVDWSNIGAGAYGSVFRVVHKASREVFAVKSVSKKLIAQHQLEEHLQRELETQKWLRHPNILRMYTHFDDGSQVHLLLEIAEAGQLFSYMRKHQPLNEPEAFRFLGHVVSAVEYLHSHDIVHRDLKPENILLCKDLVAKLADFGWCAVLPGHGGMRHTFCGTMDYLSPEMVSCLPHDHRVDVWAVGVLLYEMLAGKPPFAARSQHDAMQRILDVDLKIPDWFSPSATDLVCSLLQLLPDKRSQLKDVLQHDVLVGSLVAVAAGPNSERTSCGSLDRTNTTVQTSSTGVGRDRSPSGSSSSSIGSSCSMRNNADKASNPTSNTTAGYPASELSTGVPSPNRNRFLEAQDHWTEAQPQGKVEKTSNAWPFGHGASYDSPVANCIDGSRPVGGDPSNGGQRSHGRSHKHCDSHSSGFAQNSLQKHMQQPTPPDFTSGSTQVASRAGGAGSAVPRISFDLSDGHFDCPRKTGHILEAALVPAGSLSGLSCPGPLHSVFTPRSLEPQRPPSSVFTPRSLEPQRPPSSIFTPRSLEPQPEGGPLRRCMQPASIPKPKEPEQSTYEHHNAINSHARPEAVGSGRMPEAVSPVWASGLLPGSYAGNGLDHLRFQQQHEQPAMPQTARGKLESTEPWSKTLTYAKVREFVRAQQERMTLSRSLDLLIEEEEEDEEDVSPRKPKSPKKIMKNHITQAIRTGPSPKATSTQRKRRVSAPGSSILGSAE